jgi:hypothetical protein
MTQSFAKPPILPTKKSQQDSVKIYRLKNNLIDNRESKEKFRRADFHKPGVLLNGDGVVSLIKPPRYGSSGAHKTLVSTMDFNKFDMYIKRSESASRTPITQTL